MFRRRFRGGSREALNRLNRFTRFIPGSAPIQEAVQALEPPLNTPTPCVRFGSSSGPVRVWFGRFDLTSEGLLQLSLLVHTDTIDNRGTDSLSVASIVKRDFRNPIRFFLI